MNKLKEKIAKLNLNFQKEMLTLGIIDFILLALGVALYFFNISYLVIILVFLGIIVFSFYYLNRYDSMLLKKELALDDEFIEIFSYLKIYIANKESVYKALTNIKEFASPRMLERLDDLTNEIDNDKTIQPFINFARKFKNKVIEEVMIALFELINNGNNEAYLNQFIKIFEDFKNRRENEDKDKRFRLFDTINMMSLVGSGYIMIILSFCVIQLLGEATNGF